MHKIRISTPMMILAFIIFSYNSSWAQIRLYLAPSTKDSLRKLLIAKSRPMTRIEIGLGISQIGIKGSQWTTDFFTKARDTVEINKSPTVFSFSMGCAFPVKTFDSTTALGLNLSMLMAVGNHTALSIPAFVTFRKGGDATIYNHHTKLGFSVGIGTQMGLYVFSDIGIITNSFLRPAYMAELSVTPKFGMLKFRLIGNIGTYRKTYPYNGSSLGFNGTYKVSALTGLVVFTPFWAVQKHIDKAYR